MARIVDDQWELRNVVGVFPSAIFDTLLGGEYDFYGVDETSFCIGSNGSRMVLEAIDDPSDGYRSYFGCFATREVGKIFFKNPIARVRLGAGGLSSRYRSYGEDHDDHDKAGELKQARDNFNGWTLTDVDTGHVWLTVGTDHGEDYYPCFTFRYQPDTNQKLETTP